jgi:membrane peptidoglycan carboxypeptidase
MRRRSVAQRALQACALLLGALGAGAALLAVAALPFYYYITADLPPIAELEQWLDPQTGALLQPTRFYDRSGHELLASLQPPGAERVFIDAAEAPFLAQAFVAASDPKYWDRTGFRLPNLNAGPQGIAEELAANVVLINEPDGWRKTLRAWMLGAEASRRYDHEQILFWALNSTTFGHWTFGVESAARFYFGKAATDLTLGEAATLAAVAQAPDLNPLDAPALAKQFRGLVLTAMREQDAITDEQLNAALAESIAVVPAAIPTSIVPDFTDLALQQAIAELGTTRIERGGLKIITTLDYGTQQDVAQLAGASGLPVEVTILDPLNGRVVAMLGPAATAGHEPGNLFTPFIYLSAFAQGYAPASLAWDFEDPVAANLPANSFHGPVSMREALANNYQMPAATLVAEIGASDIAQVLRAAGFSAFRTRRPESEALQQIQGGAHVSGLEAAASLGALSNLGTRAGKFSDGELLPATLLFVSDENDKILLDWSRPDLEAVISPELSYLVTDVLADSSVRDQTINLERPAALEPATATGDEGTWAVGYSPQRVVVFWTQSSNANAASELWAGLFNTAHRDLPIQSWQVPPGLSSVIVCVPSGQLPDEDCPATRRELFLSGNEPRAAGTLFARVAINSLNGELATVFTPQEFVEERLFVNVPPEAVAWAQAAGLPILPEDYDSVPAMDANAPIAILQPAPFSQVSGTIKLLGRMGTDAVSYDVQVGQGLRPTQWLQIASSDVGATSDLLATWDTRGLIGLWAIQLQVRDSEGNLLRAYTIVTIEN